MSFDNVYIYMFCNDPEAKNYVEEKNCTQHSDFLQADFLVLLDTPPPPSPPKVQIPNS